MQFEYAQFGPVGLGEFAGSAVHIERGAGGRGSDEKLVIEIDRGSAPLLLSRQESRPALQRAATVPDGADVPRIGATGRITRRWTGLVVTRLDVLTHVPDADALATRPSDPHAPAVRHLTRYLDILGGPDGLARDVSMQARIGATLLDLVAFALISRRNIPLAGHGRGFRAGRLQEILELIDAGFADPEFSAHTVAGKLGLSARYIQDLLQDTEASFNERVLDLRLQKARALLLGDRHSALKISDVALSCGFNEVSYFHRRFRQRFGVSPAQFRDDGGPAD